MQGSQTWFKRFTQFANLIMLLMCVFVLQAKKRAKYDGVRGVEGDVTVSACGQRHALLELHAACAPSTSVQGNAVAFCLPTQDLKEATSDFHYGNDISFELSAECSVKLFPAHKTGLARYRFKRKAKPKAKGNPKEAVVEKPRAQALSGAPLTGGRDGTRIVVPNCIGEKAKSDAAAYLARKHALTQEAPADSD